MSTYTCKPLQIQLQQHRDRLIIFKVEFEFILNVSPLNWIRIHIVNNKTSQRYRFLILLKVFFLKLTVEQHLNKCQHFSDIEYVRLLIMTEIFSERERQTDRPNLIYKECLLSIMTLISNTVYPFSILSIRLFLTENVCTRK